LKKWELKKVPRLGPKETARMGLIGEENILMAEGDVTLDAPGGHRA
jgi:hypothetical protein